jgi:hypothetical protein
LDTWNLWNRLRTFHMFSLHIFRSSIQMSESLDLERVGTWALNFVLSLRLFSFHNIRSSVILYRIRMDEVFVCNKPVTTVISVRLSFSSQFYFFQKMLQLKTFSPKLSLTSNKGKLPWHCLSSTNKTPFYVCPYGKLYDMFSNYCTRISIQE